METPTLPQVVFNSLMLDNNVSILYILSGEFTAGEVYQDVSANFCIIRSSFLMPLSLKVDIYKFISC